MSMNVLWIKDNNIGHEKQVQVLLDELSNSLNTSQLNEGDKVTAGFNPNSLVIIKE